jgi:hypothetical protein
MQIRPLRRYNHPDLSDFLIHFVGRQGRENRRVPADIYAMSPKDRLFDGVLASQEIRAFPVFFALDPVVCLTECTPAGVSAMIRDRYLPWGVAFRKDFVFGRGGGPAFYVRGDEWDGVYQLPTSLRSRCTKLWPGATPDLGEVMDLALTLECQFLPEREWRVLGMGDPPSFQFDPDDVAFIVVGDWSSASDKFPTVRIDQTTGRIDDPDHVWIPEGAHSA